MLSLTQFNIGKEKPTLDSKIYKQKSDLQPGYHYTSTLD